MFNQFLAKLRKYEIRIRKAVNGERYGNFRSVFKGTGLEFDDLRPYQYGDDVRSIDWNSSAKGHGTFTKIFKEEREQTVFFILDVSASQNVGVTKRLKLDVVKELCGVLGLAAINEKSNVGLLCFSDKKELYIRPDVGMKQGYAMFSALYKLAPESGGTDLTTAVLTALNLLKKKSVVFLISDFIDSGYEPNLRALARKHDLVTIHLFDSRETDLPPLGIIPVYDPETAKLRWVNTSSKKYLSYANASFATRSGTLETLCRQHNANYISLNVADDYVPALMRLFKVRRHSATNV